MWSDDRRYHERRLREVQDELEMLEERLKLSMQELADDDHDGTEDSRARVREAREALEKLAGAVEQAREQLPVGVVRKRLV